MPNQNSNNVTAYAINAVNGALTLVGTFAAAGTPVSIAITPNLAPAAANTAAIPTLSSAGGILLTLALMVAVAVQRRRPWR